MKSCTFVDDIVLCGSDQWDIYAWKLPEDKDTDSMQIIDQSNSYFAISVEKVDEAFTILKGHRSIVNHIRYSPQNNVIVSSGVEKIIKCWSPFEGLPEGYNNPERRPMGHPSELLHNTNYPMIGDTCEGS
jgi:WD repeat-containing protein 22